MKTKFLIATLVLFITIPAFAELTVKDVTDDGYLQNHGHSKEAIWGVKKSIAEVNGEELKRPVENEKYNRPVIKQIRWFFKYLDPALDDEKFMNDHNINPTTRYDDL